MFQRQMKNELLVSSREYPVVTLLGPRQAGKTTLARHTFPHHTYVNLELPDVRLFAQEDPRSFFAQLQRPCILDEVQRVPHLLSYIQALSDEDPKHGDFILTGSHQTALRAAVTQSLAGRTAILHLLPLSIAELHHGGVNFDTFEEYIFHGFLPRIHEQQNRPTTAYANYYETYVERDVRQLINLKDVTLFQKFMKLFAGRIGQLLNLSSLANDVGVDAHTIKSWISVLEASYLVFQLPPYFENFGKRWVKSPKYYFTDVGLLSFLLGITQPEHISRDPLMGSMFENLVIIEILKSQYNQGKTGSMYFMRDQNGVEVDLVIPYGRSLNLYEIKASATYQSAMFKHLDRLHGLLPSVNERGIIYSGTDINLSDNKRLIRFNAVSDLCK